MKKLIALCFILALQASMSLRAQDLIDIAVACPPGPSIGTKNKVNLKTEHGTVECANANAYLKDVSIKEGQVRYSESLDLYMLFLFVNESDSKRLADFTRKQLHKKIFLIKDGVISISADLEAPLVNGYINIAVPSKASGNSLLDKLVPPRARSKGHSG